MLLTTLLALLLCLLVSTSLFLRQLAVGLQLHAFICVRCSCVVLSPAPCCQ
uniref:Uncharacterized protein n=1 Tax=Arundo donax TaxID=35708 RepID=A0A0A9C8P1_ARUDO